MFGKTRRHALSTSLLFALLAPAASALVACDGDGPDESSSSDEALVTDTAHLAVSRAAPSIGATKGKAIAPKVVAMAEGKFHTCVLLDTNTVRCWGAAGHGQLGYGNAVEVGSSTTPAAAGAGNVDVGAPVVDIATGDEHTCARTAAGTLRCWGRNDLGQLGYAHTRDVGVDEKPVAAGDVLIGAPIKQVAAAWSHTCVVTSSDAVRCFGFGRYGKLGYGNTNDIGDDETPSTAGDVLVGGPVKQVALGDEHTCALLSSGAVRCWGQGLTNALGYGNTDDIGDDETPAAAGNVPVGAPVAQIVAGASHTCALLTDGRVRCWGSNGLGQLGYGDTLDRATPGPDVDVGGVVVQLAAGYAHTCARLSDGAVRCWGAGNTGQNGYATVLPIGDDELPSAVGNVGLGGSAAQISSGYAHNCALLATGGVRCWGYNGNGQLGYGHTVTIGDDELPSTAGDVKIF